MKKIIKILSLLMLTFIFVAVLSTNAKAEDISNPEETSQNVEETTSEAILEPTTTIILEEEEKPLESEFEGSNANDWFNANAGMIVGVPTGTIMSILCMLIFFRKTRRKFNEFLNINENDKQFNKNVLKVERKLLAEARELQGEANTSIKCQNLKIDKCVEAINNHDIKLQDIITNQQQVIECLKKQNEALMLMASHNKEYVSNGTSEKISNLVKGE